MQQQLIAKNPSNQNKKENVQTQSNAKAKSNDLLNDAKKSEQKRQKLKSEENKIKESKMQDRLSEINGQFQKIKKKCLQCFVNKLY